MALEQAGVRLEVVGLNQFVSGMRTAEQSVDRFASSGATINRSLSGTNRAFSEVSRGAGGFGNTIAGQARTAQSSFGTFVSSVTRGAGLVVGALAPLAAGAALTGLASSAINTRITFDRELANVSAISRATAAETEQLAQQARELGASTAFQSIDVLEGQRFLGAAGFDIPDIIEALPGLLSTASAAQADLATTSDIVSNALSGFNLAASETGRVSDVLVAGLTGSNTDLQQLGTALSFAAPNAAALGVTIEETAGAIGLLSNAGIQGSRAGTTLRGILQRLASPTGEAAAELERLGINAFDAQGQFKALPDVLAEFERGLDGLNDQQRADSINTIVGTIAGTGFTALLAAGSDELRSFTEELQNSGGVAEEVAARQIDNLAGDIELLSSAYSGLQEAVTRGAEPSLRRFTQSATTGLSATTRFVEGLNEGGLTLNGFSIALQDIAPSTSFALGALSDIQDAAFGLSNINLNFDGLFGLDTLRVFRFEDLFAFEAGDLSGVIRGAFEEVSINLGDFVTFDFISGESLSFNIADFITFDSTNALTQLEIGDFITFTSEDVSSIFSDATANITKLTIGDFIDFSATSGPAGNTINVNDVIIGTYDLANNITTIAIGDIITGSLDLTTGEGSVTLGEDLTFEFDLSALQTDVQAQLTGLQDAFTAALGGDFTFDLPPVGEELQSAIDTALGGIALTFALPALAAETFEIEVPAPLLDFTIPSLETQTFEIEIPAPALNFLAPVLGDATTIDIPIPTALTDFDFGSLAGGLDTLGESLSGLDEGIAGATGEGSTLANFVTLINEQIGGLATTLDSVDSGAVGESITGVITSLTSIFTQLNTIDDLALGGIAGSLSDLTTSILSFATGLTAGIDADAVGEAAAASAATFISSFQAVFSEPDLPAISGAAAGLVAGIGEQLRTAFEPGNFTVVGASLGQLTSTIVEQLSATFSDPQFAADIGGGLADVLVGITQGLADVLDGFAAETEGAGGELSSATTGFVANLISALASGLAEANYGPVVGALLEGIGGALTGLIPGLGGGVGGLDFAAQEIEAATGQALPETQEFAVSDIIFDPVNVLDSFTGLFGSGVEVPVIPVPVGGGGFGGIAPLDDGLITESVAVAAPSVESLSGATAELATASEGATGVVGTLVNAVTGFFGLGGLSTESALEARRTGVGTGAAFDETDIAGSVQDQILSQLNFGDLPDTVATAATDAISTAIPAESLIDSEIITDALTEAVTAAIPAEPVIDADTVNETLLIAAQEAIPASEIPAFPGWQQVLDFRTPTIPRFPSWRQVLNIRVPRIPGFPGWGSFINFDIPSIPSFPGWAALTGAVDLATLVPPFPGWASLINVDIRVPNVSCELACSGGSSGGSSSGGSGGGGGGGGAGFSEFFTGTTFARGGLALVSERGDEIIVPPNGAPFIARGEQFLNLDPGTQVIDAPQSQRLLNGDTAAIGGQSIAGGSAAQGSVVASGVGGGLSGRAASGFAVTAEGNDLDEQSLASGIVESFREAFNLPNFPGWRATLGAPDIRLPPFPGWSSIVGLENISVSIFRTENIITQEETSSNDGGRDIEIGPIVPISFSAGVSTIESEAASATTAETSGGAGATAGRGASGIGSALFSASSIMASGVQSTAGSLMQSPPSVTNVTNNTNVENNFNLTTESLRSSEAVNSDFAMMERLASVSGVI